MTDSDSSPGPRDSLERLRTLTRLNQLVSSSLDQQKVLEEIARAAAVLTGARVVVFWSADESTETLQLEASWREPGIAAFPYLKRLAFEEAGGIGWVAVNRHALNVPDVFGDRRFIARDWWQAHALRSFLAFPIVYDGALLAVLGLNGSAPFVLEPDDESLLDSFLAQATGAIRNAQSYADACRREREAQALAEIGRLLASTLDLAIVGQRIAARVRDLFGAVSASVRLLDADGGLTRLGWSGQENELPSALTNPSGIGLGGRAVAERKVVWSRDTLNDPTVVLDAPLRERMVRRGGSAGLAAPFVTKGRVVGALTIADLLGRVYSDDEQALAQAFADQAALALENARLFTTERAQRERAEILGEVTRDLLADLDSSRILRRIVEALARMFAANVALFFVEGEGLLVERVTSTSSTAPVARLRFGEGLSGVCAMRRAGMLVDDYPGWPQANPLFVDAGIRHAMAQPLIVGDELLGVLTLSRSGDALPSFSHDDLATLQSFAEHTALVLRNVSLYETAERRRREAEALTQIARLLTETLDPMTVGARIVEHVLTMFPDCVSAGVSVPDGEGTQVVLASEGRLTVQFPPGHKLTRPGLADRVSRERRVVSISDLLAEAPREEPEIAARYRAMAEIGIRAAVGIPLQARDRIVGVLRLSFGEPRVLTESEIALGQAFADQAALALENARLYEEAERRRREVEVLAEIAGNIGAFLDVDTILRQVSEGARLLVRSDMARIALHDPESRSWRYRHWVNARRSDYEAARLQPAAGSLGGLVLQTGRPARTNDRLNDPRFSRDRSLVAETEGVVAQMAVPIRIGGEIEGLLFVDSRVPRNFSDADEAALMRLAEHAAIAIHDAQLFDERQRAQAALRESETLYRLLAENSADVISIFDRDLKQTYVSPSIVRLRGYTPEEAMGQPLDERLTPASRDVVARAVEDGVALEASGKASVPFRLLELEQPCKGGGTVWVEATVTPLRDGAGRRVGYLSVARDIGERKRTEAALREREEELRQAQKMESVGRLAGGIAHDFNNLLTVISGRIEIALDNPTLPAGLRRDLEVVHRTAETAALLTRQLLAFGRKQMLQSRRIDLNAVIGGLLPMLQRLIGEDVEVELGRPPAAAWVEADPGQIEQVILNLAVNARDAMPQGGRLTLGTSTVDRVDGSYVMLTVSDTGIGMDEATRSRIFEPFFTTKEVGKGRGMGLATVFGIVKQSGGDILVASEPERGTRFDIYLPRVDAPAAPHAKEQPTPAAEGTETVLVVEDEPELRSLAREALERQGYVVLEAARPSEALRIAEEHAGPIPLLLTDVVMPEMKGPQLAQRLRPRRPEMRVLYMSGYADLPEDTLGSDAPLLQKPFTTSALVQKVREILDSGRDR